MSIERHLNEGVGSNASHGNVPPNFAGTWKNRLDSEMELSVDASGDLLGTYRTGVGAPTPAEEFDLKGFVSGDLIVFCVNFEDTDL
jgi:Avidin family